MAKVTNGGGGPDVAPAPEGGRQTGDQNINVNKHSVVEYKRAPETRSAGQQLQAVNNKIPASPGAIIAPMALAAVVMTASDLYETKSLPRPGRYIAIGILTAGVALIGNYNPSLAVKVSWAAAIGIILVRGTSAAKGLQGSTTLQAGSTPTADLTSTPYASLNLTSGTGTTASGSNTSNGGTVLPKGSGKVNIGAMITLAKSAVGLPYVWGAERPGGAFDCSGLTQWAATKAGVRNFPRTTTTQWSWGQSNHVAFKGSYPISQLQPGDLIYYDFHNGPAPDHVGMYVGNGQEVQASDPALGVNIGPVNTGSMYGVVRF